MYFKHGESKSRLYRTWRGMKNRCSYPSAPDYKNYGGRGITVCDEWKDSFETFREWAISNGYDDSLTLDRINVNENYRPENCRWTTMKEQERNRSNNVFFEGKTIPEWSELLGIKVPTLRARIRRGWSISDALSKPCGNYTLKTSIVKEVV